MELIILLRILWDRRIIVGVGVLVAVGVGVLAGRKTGAPTPLGHVARLSTVLDTTDSQLVKAAPIGSSTLPARAALLADSVAGDDAARTVAHGAGVPNDQLAVLGPSTREIPPADSPLVSQVEQATSSSTAPFVVSVFADQVTPIIRIEAAAPDPPRAARLARSTAAALQMLLVREDGHRTRGFVLDTVAPLHQGRPSPSSSHTPALMVVVGGAVTAFVGWCICIVLSVAFARRLRRNPGMPRPA